MKKIIIISLLLALLNTILMVNNDFGINVIIFTIPLLIFIVWILIKYKLIKNKFGLLLLIPIIVLSSTCFVYDNSLKFLNVLIIPVLYYLLYIFTINPTDTILSTINQMFIVMLRPLNIVDNFTKKIEDKIPKFNGFNEYTKKIIKSLCIVLPIVIVVLILLSSADSIFENIFERLFNMNIPIDDFITRIIYFIILFLYLISSILFLKDSYPFEKIKRQEYKEKDALTIKLLLTFLNVIYLIFDIIQINSLLLHRVSSGFNYADYARSGFFQLMIITFINITIILLSKRSKETNYIKVMSIILVLLTYVIIVSSFFRMYLYEQAYGYTVLRLGVYTILVTEGILLLPTIAYIINKNIKIFYYYLIITLVVYTSVNLFSVDRIIAENNINRYRKTGKIDVDYLENYNYDNLNQLRELEKIIEDEVDKKNLKTYIQIMNNNNDTNIFEFNLSKENAREKEYLK